MKKLFIVIFVLGFSATLRAQPNTGDLGAGIILGDVTGPTVKYFIGPNTALDFGLGFDSDFIIVGDVVWHGWDIFPRPQTGRFVGTLAVGPRFEERDHGDDQFGIRTMAGVGYWMEPYPIEIFLELGPLFVFTPDTDTEMDAGLGVRYYFGRSSASGKRR